MRIEDVRRLLQAFSDDTRLRIVNILRDDELSVTDICYILEAQQSNISKHLSRLRLSGVVSDKKEGMNVFYSLVKPRDIVHKKLLDVVFVGLAESGQLKKDYERMQEMLAHNI